MKLFFIAQLLNYHIYFKLFDEVLLQRSFIVLMKYRTFLFSLELESRKENENH